MAPTATPVHLKISNTSKKLPPIYYDFNQCSLGGNNRFILTPRNRGRRRCPFLIEYVPRQACAMSIFLVLTTNALDERHFWGDVCTLDRHLTAFKWDLLLGHWPSRISGAAEIWPLDHLGPFRREVKQLMEVSVLFIETCASSFTKRFAPIRLKQKHTTWPLKSMDREKQTPA
jgi:hypothetical protein